MLRLASCRHSNTVPLQPNKLAQRSLLASGYKKRRQSLWPVHCLAGTPGAELHPELDLARIARTFRKGTDREIDSFSGFFDNARRKSTGLGEFLDEQGVTEIDLCGLATDYCVKATALGSLWFFSYS